MARTANGAISFPTHAEGAAMSEIYALAQAEKADEPSDEELLVNGWRFEQFKELGFLLTDVAQLAFSKVDLNDARELIGRGCPPALAARILL
jgi:hypothetical protein